VFETYTQVKMEVNLKAKFDHVNVKLSTLSKKGLERNKCLLKS
jgi:hypothetical protein